MILISHILKMCEQNWFKIVGALLKKNITTTYYNFKDQTFLFPKVNYVAKKYLEISSSRHKGCHKMSFWKVKNICWSIYCPYPKLWPHFFNATWFIHTNFLPESAQIYFLLARVVSFRGFGRKIGVDKSLMFLMLSYLNLYDHEPVFWPTINMGVIVKWMSKIESCGFNFLTN